MPFYQIRGLTINVEKTNLMAIARNTSTTLPHFYIQGRTNTNGAKLQISWHYHPSTNRWNMCYESRLKVGWYNYYMIEHQCNQSDTQGWEVRLMLFNAIVVQVLLYGVEVLGGTIIVSAWNEIEKIPKILNFLFYHAIRNRCSVNPLIWLGAWHYEMV